MKTTAPKTIKATINAIIADFNCSGVSGINNGFRSIDGLKEPEIAAKLGLDTELTFKAMAKMQKLGYVKYESTGRLGCVGWFRTCIGVIARNEGRAVADELHTAGSDFGLSAG